jgi:hypothetical protein
VDTSRGAKGSRPSQFPEKLLILSLSSLFATITLFIF